MASYADWITEADLKRALASILKAGSVAYVPSSWDEPLAAAAEEAYTFIRAVLAQRNYTTDQMDQWDSRRVYLRKITFCVLFEVQGLPEDYNSFSLDRVCAAKEELVTAPFTIKGVSIDPVGESAGVGYGDSIDDDDNTFPAPLGTVTRDTVL